MGEYIINILAITGGVALATATIVVFVLFKDWLTDQINMAIYSHKRKHRFDGAPTAKCYCKDCIFYESDAWYCTFFSKYSIEDSNFCCWASPRKHDPEKKNK